MFKFINKKPTGPVEFIIAGLGNPGKEYEKTRHNAGFMAIDEIARKNSASVSRIKFKGLCGECTIDNHKVLLLKPATFMNLSGQSIMEAMNFYKIPPEKVIIIFDDISLEPGKMRIRRKGSDGGHNGMKNIIYLSGRDDFPRIKMGVGAKPNPNYDLAKWVLSRFSEAEMKSMQEATENAANAVELIIKDETDKAMMIYNQK